MTPKTKEIIKICVQFIVQLVATILSINICI